MDRQSMYQALEGIVKARAGLRSAIAPTARFKEDLEIDSLLVVDIVVDIEKRFDVALPDAELVHLTTLDTATDLVLRLVPKGEPWHGGAQERLQAPLLGVVRDLA